MKMTKIEIKGSIISNDYKEIYDWMGYESTSPKDVADSLPNDNSDVEIIINSGGGHVEAGKEMYSILKEYPGKVTAKVYSMAGSAASLPAMAADETLMSPVAQIMIHNVSTVSQGDNRDHAHTADVLKSYNEAIANAYVNKTGLSKDEILKMMDDETYLNADKAIELGFANGVLFEEKIQFVASTSAILSNDVINKARMMMKQEPNMNIESKLDVIENKIQNLTNQLEEMKNEGPKVIQNKVKRFL